MGQLQKHFLNSNDIEKLHTVVAKMPRKNGLILWCIWIVRAICYNRIYSKNIDFYHVKGDFTEVHFLWFLENCAVVAAKTITFALILNQQLAALQSIRLNFKKKKKNTRIVGHGGILVHFSAHSNLNSSEILLKHTVGKKMGKWYNLLLNYLKSFLNFHYGNPFKSIMSNTNFMLP